jgi:hypothetical protein
MRRKNNPQILPLAFIISLLLLIYLQQENILVYSFSLGAEIAL